LHVKELPAIKGGHLAKRWRERPLTAFVSGLADEEEGQGDDLDLEDYMKDLGDDDDEEDCATKE
jgi:hypothetical protein